jgi:hypothetical protein
MRASPRSSRSSAPTRPLDVDARSDSPRGLVIWATRVLDERVKWFGQKVFQTSGLAWPRAGVKDKEGFPIDDNLVPHPVKVAVAVLAEHLVATATRTSWTPRCQQEDDQGGRGGTGVRPTHHVPQWPIEVDLILKASVTARSAVVDPSASSSTKSCPISHQLTQQLVADAITKQLPGLTKTVVVRYFVSNGGYDAESDSYQNVYNDVAGVVCIAAKPTFADVSELFRSSTPRPSASSPASSSPRSRSKTPATSRSTACGGRSPRWSRFRAESVYLVFVTRE